MRRVLTVILSLLIATGAFAARPWGASVRTLGAIFTGDQKTDALSQTIARGTSRFERDRLAVEVHLVQTLTVTDLESPLGGAVDLAPVEPLYRAADLSWEWLEERRAQAVLSLDRLNASMSFAWGDVIAGRQAVTFGKTFFWNPLDLFSPFDPNQFDRDYKPGVDALRVEIPLDSFSGLTVVGAPGRERTAAGRFVDGERTLGASWRGSALIGRWYANVRHWDLALQSGKVYGGAHAGAGAVGDWKGWQLRAEAAQFFADGDSSPLPPGAAAEGRSHLSAVLGTGRFFTSDADVESELYFNGVGEAGANRWLWGFLLRDQFHPLASAQVGPIVSINDGSAQIQPQLTVSLADEIDFLLGLILNVGPRSSEFGGDPDIVYAEFKWYL